MKRVTVLLLFAVAACAAGVVAQASAETPTLIRAGRVFDPGTGSIATNQLILVRGSRIEAVGSRIRAPGDARVVDLSNYTVMPGLIDAHVHLAIGGPPANNAAADVRAGFTTVVDLGSRTNRLLRVRDSLGNGDNWPRVLASGMWIGARGGVCEFSGLGIPGGPDDYAARVRENVAAGANVIKVCLSGWPGAAHARPDSVELTTEALDAVLREARAARRLVIAHAISRASVESGIRAGVNGLAHTAYIDAALAAELRRRGTFMITTIASLTSGDTSAPAKALRESLRVAHRAGVRLVAGTDGGVLPHGQNATELLALRELGLTPLEVIQAATTNAAQALGIADSVGTIKAGMSADFIAVEGDPRERLEVLRNPRFVMTRGRPVVSVPPR